MYSIYWKDKGQARMAGTQYDTPLGEVETYDELETVMGVLQKAIKTMDIYARPHKVYSLSDDGTQELAIKGETGEWL